MAVLAYGDQVTQLGQCWQTAVEGHGVLYLSDYTNKYKLLNLFYQLKDIA